MFPLAMLLIFLTVTLGLFAGCYAVSGFLFPDLDAGNIAYKLLTAFGGAEAVGPILLGMRKAVTVLSQNSAVETIVHMAAITVATNRMARERG